MALSFDDCNGCKESYPSDIVVTIPTTSKPSSAPCTALQIRASEEEKHHLSDEKQEQRFCSRHVGKARAVKGRGRSEFTTCDTARRRPPQPATTAPRSGSCGPCV
ncbi:hypothetical protein Bbelb_240010 [Branchiostoma belcheri]|nr:hypothetical protein Bbelb_240010 [Branchiostoma belcheri]